MSTNKTSLATIDAVMRLRRAKARLDRVIEEVTETGELTPSQIKYVVEGETGIKRPKRKKVEASS